MLDLVELSFLISRKCHSSQFAFSFRNLRLQIHNVLPSHVNAYEIRRLTLLCLVSLNCLNKYVWYITFFSGSKYFVNTLTADSKSFASSSSNVLKISYTSGPAWYNNKARFLPSSLILYLLRLNMC